MGFIALVVPRVILTLMLSLVLPILIIERSRFQSLHRSRKLIGHRWAKTLVLFIVFGIIIGVASEAVILITSQFGVTGTILFAILCSFYFPLIPIMLTVCYYSNAARIAVITTPPPPPPTLGQQAIKLRKFCFRFGTRLESDATFFSNCGAKQYALIKNKVFHATAAL